MNIEEINNNRLNDEKELIANDDIYESPEEWGDAYCGTREDFIELIDATSGFGSDWYKQVKNEAISEGEDYPTVEEYETQLLGEIVSVEIDE